MNARDVALHVVRDVFPQQGAQERGAQESLDYRSRKANLEPRDRAFATELAYGSIKMRRTLDWYLKPFIGERPQPPPQAIHEILRLAVYELVYTRADEHATVFEWVNLAKKYGHRGVANLVNAVLRSFLRDRPLPPTRDLFENDDEYVGTRYSLPSWIVRQLRAVFGDERLEEICDALNAAPQTAVTVNALKTTRDDLAARWDGARPSAFVPESLLVADAPRALREEPKAAGAWWIQSESSAMVADVAQPQPGESVLDVCSGRGNKALQTGARLAGEGTLLCVEQDERRAAVLQNRLEEAGIGAGVVVGDASTDLLEPGQQFDRIIVDAPCSGVGVIGRHPEARWKKRDADGERLAFTQRAILEAVSRHVHPGGALVYAVCSTDPRETSGVVERFLQGQNFERGLIPAAYESFLTGEGDVLVPPGIDGRDGFYIARLERRLT